MIVAIGKGDAFYQSAVQFLRRPFIRLTPLDETQLWAAVRAYQGFGKRRHPASLNSAIPFRTLGVGYNAPATSAVQR